MSLEVHTHRDPTSGELVTVIELRGPHDTIRFADRMLEWQCEFGSAGRLILRRLRRHLGARGFDGYATYLGLSQRTIASSKQRRAS